MTQGTDSDPAATAPKARPPSDLGPRTASAVVMVVAALLVLWQGGDLFVVFWLLCSLAVLWEWQTIIDAAAARSRFFCGAICLTLAGVALRQTFFEGCFAAILIGAGVSAWLAGEGKRVWAAAGVFYAAALVVSVTLLRFLSVFSGIEAILWLFAVVWGTDIFAYFGGRMIGGPKLWPRVSPSKTWSGFIVGVTFGALLGLLTLALAVGSDGASLAPLFVLGLATGMVAQGGDLLESSIKRRFGKKDSSHLIPGHGGFMDRLDGFIVAATFAALVGWMNSAGIGYVAIGLLRW